MYLVKRYQSGVETASYGPFPEREDAADIWRRLRKYAPEDHVVLVPAVSLMPLVMSPDTAKEETS